LTLLGDLMKWVVPVKSVVLVLFFLAGCSLSSTPTPSPAPPQFATHLPFPTVVIVPTPTPKPALTLREVARLVIDGLDYCLAAEFSSGPFSPSAEALWLSRNFGTRYIGGGSWLVRASFELPNGPREFGDWLVDDRTGRMVASGSGRSVVEYCQAMLASKDAPR